MVSDRGRARAQSVCADAQATKQKRRGTKWRAEGSRGQGGGVRGGFRLTRPVPSESLTPGPRCLGRVGVVIVAAILAGPPAQSSGCARCGASTPAVTGAPFPQPARFRLQRVWRKALARRTGETRTVAVGGSYFVCVRACDGGFFPVPYVGRPRLAREDLPGIVSERGNAALFHVVWRHDRGRHFNVRRVVR